MSEPSEPGQLNPEDEELATEAAKGYQYQTERILFQEIRNELMQRLLEREEIDYSTRRWKRLKIIGFSIATFVAISYGVVILSEAVTKAVPGSNESQIILIVILVLLGGVGVLFLLGRKVSTTSVNPVENRVRDIRAQEVHLYRKIKRDIDVVLGRLR